MIDRNEVTYTVIKTVELDFAGSCWFTVCQIPLTNIMTSSLSAGSVVGFFWLLHCHPVVIHKRCQIHLTLVLSSSLVYSENIWDVSVSTDTNKQLIQQSYWYHHGTIE